MRWPTIVAAAAAALSMWLWMTPPLARFMGPDRGQRRVMVPALVLCAAVLVPHTWIGLMLVLAPASWAGRLLWRRRTVARLAEANAARMGEV